MGFRRSHPVLSDLLTLLAKVGVVLACIWALCTFVFRPLRMPDDSMAPQVRAGDLVLCYRLDKDFAAGDVAGFDAGGSASCARVVAVAGDTVDLDEEGLVVNGNHVADSYAQGRTLPAEGGVTFPLEVPEGSIFLLSDNREQGHDSRVTGCVSADETSGTAVGLFRHGDI